MKFTLYPRLALLGMSKNKKLYLPYFLTAAGLVMMFYIVSFLGTSDLILSMRGGRTASYLLILGSFVIAVFSLFFLFYSYSFLIRRRKTEFGLYNILGMGKGHLTGILATESLFLFLGAFLFGSFLGVALSKLFELALVQILQGSVTYRISVSPATVRNAFLLYGGIFLLLFLYTVWGIYRSGSLSLLQSERQGEKEPRAKTPLAFLGLLCLAAAYAIAILAKTPLSALFLFFIAVILVIIGTYLLFMVGSVALCRFLKKRKSYYYKPAHFVSVSSMSYCMKRNGAGLASIAILATMVLVMLSSTTCLYMGMEDSLRLRYPRDYSLQLSFRSPENLTEETVGFYRNVVHATAEEEGETLENLLEYRVAYMDGRLENGTFFYDERALNAFQLTTYSDLVQLYLLPLEDYNRMAGADETLADDEILLYSFGAKEIGTTFRMGEGKVYRVKKTLEDIAVKGLVSGNMLPGIFVVLPNFVEDLKPPASWTGSGGQSVLSLKWFCQFDVADTKSGELLRDALHESLRQPSTDNIGGLDWYLCSSLEGEKENFFGTYGGLFFLGILLSAVFLFATVLMIYYKQISEGYEDQPRFAVMQKVGMTEKEIRKSINSQMRTVFFLPLAAAGIHLLFAFPIIRRMLLLFGMSNAKLFLITNLVSFLIFSLFYAVVYLITSEVYCGIVSGKRSGRTGA